MINQKGGVGKTTSTVNLGAALAQLGKRVMLIDLDAQAHLTLHLGIDPAGTKKTMYHLMADDDVTVDQIACEVSENLVVLPAEVSLAGIEAELAPKMVTGGAQRVLMNKLAPGSNPSGSNPGADSTKFDLQAFDYIIIDCPPSLGLLTINALVAANEIVVPMQAHFLALQGLSKLFETVSLIRQSFNERLVVSGIILCMFEGQTILAGEVIADITSYLDAHRQMDVPWKNAVMLKPAVRRNIKLAESPSFGQTIFDYESHCAGAKDYRALAESLAAQRVGG